MTTYGKKGLICIKRHDGALTKKEEAVSRLAVKVMTSKERKSFQHVQNVWWDPKNQKLVTNPRIHRE